MGGKLAGRGCSGPCHRRLGDVAEGEGGSINIAGWPWTEICIESLSGDDRGRYFDCCALSKRFVRTDARCLAPSVRSRGCNWGCVLCQYRADHGNFLHDAWHNRSLQSGSLVELVHGRRIRSVANRLRSRHCKEVRWLDITRPRLIRSRSRSATARFKAARPIWTALSTNPYAWVSSARSQLMKQ